MARTNTTTTNKSAAASGKRWVVDQATKRTVATTGNQDADKLIADIKARKLPPDIEAAALLGIQAAAKADKPFSLAIARGQEAGFMDLIEISGGFKSKQLSPNLVRAIAQNAKFVLAFLEQVHAADE